MRWELALVPVPALTGALSAMSNPKIEASSPLSPKSWVYGVVWPSLYVLVGFSWALNLYKTPLLHGALVIALFLWTPVYTRLSKTLAVCVAGASLAIAVTLVSMYRSWLLVPLVAWLAFALIVNVDEAFVVIERPMAASV